MSPSTDTRRNLHSFPTRRSSDLLKPVVNAFKNSRDDERWLRNYCPTCGSSPAMAQLVGTDPERLRLLSCGDRKSTRLNSSHPSISYAVFCLKKKTSEASSLNTPE